MRGRSRRQSTRSPQFEQQRAPRTPNDDPAWTGPGWSMGNAPFLDENMPGAARAGWDDPRWDRVGGTNDMAQGRGILRNYGNMGPEVGGSFTDEPLRGPHSGKGPKSYKRPDARIHEDACDALTEHHDIDATHVEVTVKDGEVTLEGTVDSRASKRLAEDIIHGVRGVFDVHNRLRIQAAAEPGSDDARPQTQKSNGAVRH